LVFKNGSRYQRHLVLVLGILGCAGFDQGLKAWVSAVLPVGQSIEIWPNVLHLTHVHNTGAAFSLFHQFPQGLTLLSSLIFVGLLGYVWRLAVLTPAQIVVFTLILGGALGNLWDRWTLGYVVDYVDVAAIHYPVFNWADICICTGIALWLILSVRQRKPLQSL